MMRTPSRSVLGLAWLMVIACWLGLSTPPVSAQTVLVDRDIVYYDGPGFYAPRHILDVYRLEGSENRPVLFFIHGGAWTSGNKNQFAYLGNFFARQGYVAVLANYRLTDNSPGRVTHPGHIQDVASAFAWTYGNVAAYGGDPEHIFVSGHSAGGHLVALLAADPRYLAAHALSPDAISGVIPLSGVYDVRGIANVFGNAAQQRDASPIFHVGDWPSPPLLILYAEFDLGNLGAQAILYYALQMMLPAEVGGAELIMFPGRDHGTIVSRIAQPGDAVAAAMLRFMAEH